MPQSPDENNKDDETTGAEFASFFRERRQNLEELSRILDTLEGDGGFLPSNDPDFWNSFARIEAAGLTRDKAEVSWLAGLTQVDDLGPMGRAMFLAFAALEALKRMPEETFQEARLILATLSREASIYRKTGVCKLLEVSQTAEAIPLLENLIEGSDLYVRLEGEECLKRLRAKL